MNDGPDSDPASGEAFAEALGALADADYRRLYAIARTRAYLLYDIGHEDLLHMAIERALSGTRRWPQDVPVVAFLAEVMRSIAADYLNRRERHAGDDQIDDDRDHLNPGKQQSTPEGLYYVKRAMDVADEFFAADEEAWLVMTARIEGYEGAEIKQKLGLTTQQYWAACKRIRRNLPYLKREVNDE